MEPDKAPSITGKTQLLALLASPSEHSLSPRMHDLALSHLGLDYVYLAFNTGKEMLGQTIDTFRMLNIRGWNLSTPNKIKVLDYLDDISPEVKLIGACNTVINDNGRLRGENTDGLGFIRSLESESVEFKGKKMTVLGVGGVASAIIAQCSLNGIGAIDVYNRKDDFFAGSKKFLKEISEQTNIEINLHDLDNRAQLHASLQESSILTNATSVGFTTATQGMSPLIDESGLHPALFVADVIYAPLKTLFLKQAERNGCRFMNGIPLVIHQGAESFKLWTGYDMPVGYVKKCLFGI